MSIHDGILSSKTSSAVDLSDIEKKLSDVKKTADTNKSTIAVHDVTVRANERDLVLVNRAITANTSSISTNTSKVGTKMTRSIFAKAKALEVEQDVATNKTSITTNSNYIQTNKTDIFEALTKANTNRGDIALLKKHFAYEFSFYYVNLASYTWHHPQVIKAGYPTPWVFFDEPTDQTKVRLMGHLFDGDTLIDTRSRVKMEYKVKILKNDGGIEEAQLYYQDILPKKIGGLTFYIGEEKSLKDMFPSHYSNTRALQIQIKIHESGSLGNESILTGCVYQ